ncbi:MAG TPA: CHRD domain-containing protein [Thermoanaerobaculia bacterium]|nr:CHRD domain-containing protein [Thermoanaerobaculia bacterium]
MFNRSLRRLCLSLLLTFAAHGAFAQTFIFDLRGDQEVPPEPSVATAGCMGTLNQGAATFSVTCVHNVVGATVMHIHKGAPGVNGPILFDLGNPASPVVATWSGMSPQNIADMLAGNLYINIHTAGRPAGEIRGQILPRTVDTVAFTADGPHFVPPNGTSATASCTANLSDDATQLAIQCTHNLPSPTSAEIHEEPIGTNGPVVFTFPSPASPLSANMPMTPRLVADFAATFLALEIHSGSGAEDSSSANIRGQIGNPPEGAGTGTIRIVKQTSPAGGTGFGFTETMTSTPFTLDDAQTRTFTGVAAGAYTVTENDPSSLGYSLADISCDDANSTGNVSTRAASINLDPGEVVTCRFRNVLASPTDDLFIFHLSGDQEVPPVATQARGGCMGRFHASTSSLTLVCTHTVSGPTVMHIHKGAPGVNGPVIFDLGSPVSPVIATWSGVSPANVADLFAGNYYINIHTAGRPGGEIRGQVLPRTVDTVPFTADSSQVVPPGSSASTATCSANLNDPATALAVQCTHNLPSPSAAHVHEGPFGANGPEVFTFPSPASPFSADMPMSPRLVADFAGGLLYLDIIGSGGGDDEGADQIRGQIGGLPVAFTTGTIRIVKQSTPAGATGFGFTDNVPGSGGSFTLNDGGTQTFSNVTAGTYTITENARSGFALADVTCSDDDSAGNPFARTATIHLQPGELVTCTFRNLQTFTAPTNFVFHLSGDQEVPPVPTTARGGCMAQFDAASSSLSLVCTHNVVDATVMHIHRGAAGVNGPIIHDLGDPHSPVQAVWSGMTPEQVADLLAGNYYVNIHTGGRPAGALRGQLLPRTVDSFSFGADGAQVVPPSGSTATGDCSADLSTDATSLFVQCSHDVAGATAARLNDAPPGSNGPLVFTFPLTNPFSGNIPMSPRLVADFAAGFLYVDVATTDNPNGEIRGQLIAGADVTGETIPTLTEWMIALLAMMLVGAAWWRLR